MDMKFHKKLYIGESIENVTHVKWKLKHNAGQLGIFVIVLAQGDDQLEIFHCAFLQQRYYKEHPPYIVGIAKGYDEALSLLQKMVADSYQKMGHYKLKEYFFSN